MSEQLASIFVRSGVRLYCCSSALFRGHSATKDQSPRARRFACSGLQPVWAARVCVCVRMRTAVVLAASKQALLAARYARTMVLCAPPHASQASMIHLHSFDFFVVKSYTLFFPPPPPHPLFFSVSEPAVQSQQHLCVTAWLGPRVVRCGVANHVDRAMAHQRKPPCVLPQTHGCADEQTHKMVVQVVHLTAHIHAPSLSLYLHRASPRSTTPYLPCS